MQSDEIHDNPSVQGTPILELAVLGGLQARLGKTVLEIGKEKAVALLVLLLIDSPYRTSRAMARGLLWSDVEESAAQNSLRNTLWMLRKLLRDKGFEGLHSTRSEIWLDPERTTTDLDEALSALLEGNVSAAFFPDQGFPDTVFGCAFTTDLFESRVQSYRSALVGHVIEIAEKGRSRISPAVNVDILQLLYALDPLNEKRGRTLISALVSEGRKADALAVYQKLWTLLEDEYGEEPASETQALVIALKQDAPGVLGFADGKPIIVVESRTEAAWESESRDDLREFFLSTIVRFREWRVIDETYDPDIDSLLVQSACPVCKLVLTPTPGFDTGYQLNAILIDLRTGQVLWSENVTVNPDQREAKIDMAVRQLAVALNLHLSGPSHPLGFGESGGADQHYFQWIEAQHLMRQFTRDGWQKAEQLLDEILDVSPYFVRALSTRASIETMRHIAFPGIVSTPELHRRALRWASSATLADPMDSRAQLALAWSCAMSRQFDRAEIAYELAFQSNENDPWTITSAMVGFAFCDQISRVHMLNSYSTQLNLTLEPVHWSYMAAASFLAGDHEKCIEYSENAKEISCDVPAWHSAALAICGELDEAHRVAGRFIQVTQDNWIEGKSASEQEVLGWLLSCFPIRNREKWHQLRMGLELSGLKLPNL